MPDRVFMPLEDSVREAADRFRLRGIVIDGVEVTQAIQYRGAADHLTDAADRRPDNSLRLVADKPAVVRVFVHTLFGEARDVTATVTLQRMKYGVWAQGSALGQNWPPRIVAEATPDYATERGRLGSSLNFTIPGAEMRGLMRLHVRVESAERASVDESDVVVSATLRQTLRVRGIPVRYLGPDAAGDQTELTAPTLADFQTTAAWTLNAWPVSPTPDITLAGAFTWQAPLLGAIPASGCPTSWSNLLFWLGVARVVDGNRPDRLYYALLPNGIPLGQATGCGGGDAGAGAGFAGDGMTMVHELGHVLGFTHAPCGPVTAIDAGYPAYEPYDSPSARTASIGEYGFDVTANTVMSPATARDFMSYCGPSWISLYHYRQLLQNPRLDPRTVPAPRDQFDLVEVEWPPRIGPRDPGPVERPVVDFLREVDPEDLVIVSGLLHDDERLEILSVLSLEAVPTVEGSWVSGAFVELVDGGGAVVSRAALRQVGHHPSCGCGPEGRDGEQPATLLVQALLPRPAEPVEGGSLRVLRDGDEIWSRQSPDRPPAVTDVAADVDGDRVLVRWTTERGSDAEVQSYVRISTDRGRSWQLLAFGADGSADAPLETAGEGRAMVQVVVSDGFSTVTSEPARIELPPRAPTVAILWPAEGVVVRGGVPLRLWGGAAASDGARLDGDEVEWELDGDRVASGPDAWVDLPDGDEHRVTLRVRSGGFESETTRGFTSVRVRE